MAERVSVVSLRAGETTWFSDAHVRRELVRDLLIALFDPSGAVSSSQGLQLYRSSASHDWVRAAFVPL